MNTLQTQYTYYCIYTIALITFYHRQDQELLSRVTLQLCRIMVIYNDQAIDLEKLLKQYNELLRLCYLLEEIHKAQKGGSHVTIQLTTVLKAISQHQSTQLGA
ncbi:hypothetical protein [Thalassomonas sp. M1454]|uniref:hypothetical protein n=1 Tax=Thalassomonas sp. M1454 TaxID=2594477 RepID=UPI00117FFD53|nr:hypothetical protein [Thalassomonas sp. M1454]TRX57181.1 hypothetical protein FNN08_06695 [Thalassomonas sp. M1454]